jgi:hypothetical protein
LRGLLIVEGLVIDVIAVFGVWGRHSERVHDNERLGVRGLITRTRGIRKVSVRDGTCQFRQNPWFPLVEFSSVQ